MASQSKTLAYQSKLPKLPVPKLEDTCRRYLRALEPLQDKEDHEETKRVVAEFLEKDGPPLHEKLLKWAETKDSYIEEFWYEAYLKHTDPVVLALNPFFVLENDPTPSRGAQLPRAAALIVSSLGFIHDLRAGTLSPDFVRNKPLDMDQYSRLFGTARIPTQTTCKMQVNAESRHVVVMRRGQFYWFEVLDEDNLPLVTEREVLRNLQAIVTDADKTPIGEVARNAVGVLSTEHRKTWSELRNLLSSSESQPASAKTTPHTASNAQNLSLIDNALFVVCLDDSTPDSLADLCSSFLCGTYRLENGVQVGTCTNRWYDKLQIIVCADGSAGINFEHTGVDGHTVLRFAADIFTEGLMLLARSINPTAPTLFHAPLSQHSKSYKPPRPSTPSKDGVTPVDADITDTTPKKLIWHLPKEVLISIRFAETRLSDLICQNDCQALEFRGYGKNLITSHGFSPDAFVQMAFQAAYWGLYGRTECVYEPAMTKGFLHGRTEAIRSVQKESVDFVKVFFSDKEAEEKVRSLRKACERHVEVTKECGKGEGQDRHLYALYCLLQRDLRNSPNGERKKELPAFFRDAGWNLLNTSILSTSNCGNPALRLFGFGPVAADGYGIGYIIKEDGISVCASSKHLQTRRFLDTLQSYLLDIQRILINVHRAANERPAPFVDHAGILRDSKTGRAIDGYEGDQGDADDIFAVPGYSFFDSGEVELVRHQKRSPYYNVGKSLQLGE